MSNYTDSLLTRGFYNKDISAKIKAIFSLNPHFWLVCLVTGIAHYKKNVFVIARTNIKKV